ncbi:MAG: hypothetical protein KDD51_06510 [Bdellovibrionales bacterium]|nr:hypothetical protein [Bdellovibrionales bacterium]
MRLFRKTRNVAAATFRSQQIVFVFSRYAVWEGLFALGLELGKRGLAFSRPRRANIPLDAVFGKKLAVALYRLGPTFVKLGQMLALRPDLIGDPVASELRVLFDQVPPLRFGVIKGILKNELGKRVVSEAFSRIEPKPLGCASLAQVHQAELKDGTPVILKVQKRGAAKLVRMDLRLLEGVAKSADLAFPRYGIRQMYEDFYHATIREIDYREEAKNIDQFRKNYRGFFTSADVIFPRYYPELSTERVLTMEPLRGRKISQLQQGSTVARQAASQSVAAVLEQIFDHGFFHADPHAGNLFFMEEEGKIGFIDLGLVGQLNPEDKRRFLRVLMAVLKRDKPGLVKGIYELGDPSPKTDYQKFEADIYALMDEVKNTGVKKAKLDKVVNQLLGIARSHRILIPNRYVLMLRAFLIIEGVAKSLDPNLSMFQMAPPIVARSLMKTYNPFRLFRR